MCGKSQPRGRRQVNFLPDPGVLPKAGDAEWAEAGFARWAEICERADDPALAAFARDLGDDVAGRALLSTLFGNSPWLTHCVVHDPAFFRRIVEKGLEPAFEEALSDAGAEPGRAEAETMAALRHARRRAALVVALADIAGAWDLTRVMAALSRFADAAVASALATLTAEAVRRGEIAVAEAADPAAFSGLFILGLGKLGAHELNYSSDIDLIALYDEDRQPYTGRQSPQQLNVRIVRDLVRMLESRTRDGYVFRTDLRLRPDPGSTPLAVSVTAAELYYESTGQNWERAALMKARVIAGDAAAGAEFLRTLEPFLWRKNLDFAAIEDIHSIKRQINAHRGGEAIAVRGHNLKLGRGGIREIEFFGQTQQLIWGGRVPELRTPATCDTLAALAAEGRITESVARELTDAYAYLRRAEHRLQMVDDRQTHTVPEDDVALRRFAAFLGDQSVDAFAEELTGHLSRVEHHYARLFEESPPLSGPGNLVFTGGEDDPDTLCTLGDMGFVETSMISERIRAWHRGRYPATRSARARELLTELVPALLDALSRTASPDSAFRNFDQFLGRLPAGVQLFSLFLANPGLLALVAEVMGSAPKLAGYLAANPSLLDGVLTGDFYGAIDDRETLRCDLADMLSRSRHFEDTLDRSRRFANDHKFKIGMQILRGQLDADAAGAALSDLADVVVGALLDVARGEMERRHGRIGGRTMCVVALGKLGGRELTENSDLDLLFVYDDAGRGDAAEVSDGPRPLAASQYFARLSQQLITALSAPTAEGKLYEVDMRLRPSGNAGPIATSLTAFRRYQAASAWTWEHMALTRARVVAGGEAVTAEVEAAIRDVLSAGRDAEKLRADVAHMRGRLARGHAPASTWDVKYAAGGLIDVEFIAQYLQLAHAHDRPEVLATGTTEAYRRLAEAGAIAPRIAQRLARAGKLWRTIQGMLRFTYEGTFEEDAAPGGLRAALARAAGAEDFGALKREMRRQARWVRGTFVRLIGEPADAATEQATTESQQDGGPT